MPKFIDITGKRFGRLVVVSQKGRDRAKKILWECSCDCGNTIVIVGGSLSSGNSRSCGCYHRENLSARVTKHGAIKTTLYHRWKGMRNRVNNKNFKQYQDYGGRGIDICERWESFENFAEDMGGSFSPELTLERVDNNMGYSPENCRWATRVEQQRNTRFNRHITYNGESLTMSEWMERTGGNRNRVERRLRLGWSVGEALGFVKGGNKMKGSIVALLTATILTGCAGGYATSTWSPVVDVYGSPGKSPESYQYDLKACQTLAEQRNQVGDAAVGAGVGGALGAAGGAIGGAFAGSPGLGAAIGAASGAFLGGVSGGYQSNTGRQDIVMSCMMGRGWTVLSR